MGYLNGLDEKSLLVKEKKEWSSSYLEPYNKYFNGKGKAKYELFKSVIQKAGLLEALTKKDLNIFIPCGFIGAFGVKVLLELKGSCLSVDLIPASCMVTAKQEAEKHKLNITLLGDTDLNHYSLPENKFDLIICESALHHLWNFEFIFPMWHNSLKPDGIIYINDSTGRNRLLGYDDNIHIANLLWQLLPAEYRINDLNTYIDKIEQVVQPAKPTTFEAIRSEEIVKFVDKTFNIIYKKEHESVMHRMNCAKAYKTKWMQNKKIYDAMSALDELFIQKGILKGENTTIVASKK